MAEYTQSGRPIRVDTPLPSDTLLLERVTGEEAVSRPYAFQLDLLSTDPGVDPKKLLRKPICVTVELQAGGQRFIHGLVRRFVQLGRGVDNLTSYRADVVPAIWFLSLTTDCRIFQNKTAPDIVKAVLDQMGVTDVRWALTGSFTTREYCVQYRETNLDFISRLLEEEGIFYFFEHVKDKHTLVLANASSAVKAGPVAKVPMTLVKGGGLNDFITDLEIDSEVVSGKVKLVDYNFETPGLSLMSLVSGGNLGTSVEQLAKFDYPGNFRAPGDGDRLARLRLEEDEALGSVVIGSTTYRGLASGQKLEITDHYRRDVNQPYHVISATHDGKEGTYRSVAGVEAFAFKTDFQAIPFSVPYRPARVTPRSIVHGSQTAIVVGPAGEEIYVDKYSRVKVQFFWDQQGKKDENSSCWVRVSSTWAGKTWGFIQIPRIGQEVIVDFLEGDPDRPIITGRVYNAEQMPPYPLPGNGTQSGLKTRSATGGDPATFNELRFEDKKGSEQVFLHAEKNQDIEVENDETHWVGHDRTKTIDHDETTHVKHDRTETVDNDETITIHGNRSETLDKNETITIHGDRNETVHKDEQITVHGKRTEMVDKDESVTVSQGNRQVTISQGNETLAVKMGNVSSKVDMGNVDTKVGMGNVTLKADLGAVTYEAMQGIELKVGQSSIKIDQTGVTIKGMMISIQGQVQTEVKGLMTSVKADAILMVKGAMTMIN